MNKLVIFLVLVSSYLNCMNDTEGRRVLVDLCKNNPLYKRPVNRKKNKTVFITFYISDRLPALERKKK